MFVGGIIAKCKCSKIINNFIFLSSGDKALICATANKRACNINKKQRGRFDSHLYYANKYKIKTELNAKMGSYLGHKLGKIRPGIKQFQNPIKFSSVLTMTK